MLTADTVNASTWAWLGEAVTTGMASLPTEEEVPLDTGTANRWTSAEYLKKVYLGIGTFGVLDNLMVIIVILQCQKMRSTLNNKFIVNQSLIDGTASLFQIITAYVGRDGSGISTHTGKDIHCRIWLSNLIMWGTFYGSSYNLAAITIERYIGIVYPFVHKKVVTKKRGIAVMISIWVLCMFYSIVLGWFTSALTPAGCSIHSEFPTKPTRHAVGIVHFNFVLIIPLLVILFCYTHIFYVLSKSVSGKTAGEQGSAASDNRDAALHRARVNVAKTCLLINLMFVVCFTPQGVMYLYYILERPGVDFGGDLYHITVIMMYFNCTVNPVIYCIKYHEFQKELKTLICKINPKYETAENSVSENTAQSVVSNSKF